MRFNRRNITAQIGMRFSRPSKETLIGWVNERNNREFRADQFVFGHPTRIRRDGTVAIPFTYLPTKEQSVLEVQRIRLSKIPGLSEIYIHTRSLETEDILQAIFDQYGLYLEEDYVTVTIEDRSIIDLEQHLLGSRLNGFVNKEGEEVDLDELTYGLRQEVRCKIRMAREHLVYTGSLDVVIHPSLEFNSDTIDRQISMRDYYTHHDDERPFVEFYQPKGLWCVDESTRYSRRDLESRLYNIGNGVVDYELLSNLLTELTRTEWVAVGHEAPFNLMNCEVLYNGLSGEYPDVAPVTHTYLLVLELSDLCQNLQGRINIAYRYSTPNHPAAYPGGFNTLI